MHDSLGLVNEKKMGGLYLGGGLSDRDMPLLLNIVELEASVLLCLSKFCSIREMYRSQSNYGSQIVEYRMVNTKSFSFNIS